MNKSLLLIIISFLAFKVSFADVRLPAIVSDGMILQRNTTLTIWGWADKDEAVSVRFKGKIYQTVTPNNKRWKIEIDPMNAGGPFEMTIKGHNSITVKDILIGDVWLASGQSNMEFEMSKAQDLYAEEIASSNNSSIRQFEVVKRLSFTTELDDVETKSGWQAVTPKNLLNFTAIGYFCAKELYQKYKVPIGIINATWGGTPAEAWISVKGLKKFDNHSSKARTFFNTDTLNAIKTKDKEATDSWFQYILNNDKGLLAKGKNWGNTNIIPQNWQNTNLPSFWRDSILKNVEAGVVWYQRTFTVPRDLIDKKATLYLGNIYNQDSTWINGMLVGNTTDKHKARIYNLDNNVLKAGENNIIIRVLALSSPPGFVKDKPYYLQINKSKIELSGTWKYELGASSKAIPSTTNLAYQPAVLYKGMIAPLRQFAIKGVIWYQGEANTARATEYQTLLPSLIKDWRNHFNIPNLPFLYVQLPNYLAVKPVPSQSNWAELREAQLKTLSLTNTGMAVTYDLGEWNDIHPRRKQEVGYRLALSARKVAYRENLVHSGPIYKSISLKGDRIIISFKNTGSGLISMDGKPLKYFAIAGIDNQFVWANAKIVGDRVEVWNDEIKQPISVRYAWADNPDGANLYNREGLPASPFRTDSLTYNR